MPKAARSSSARTSGGRGPRFSTAPTTLTGRPRSSERWTAIAAIAAQTQILLAMEEPSLLATKFPKQALCKVLQEPARLAAFLEAAPVRLAPAPDRAIVKAVLTNYAGKVLAKPAQAATIAKQLWQRILANAGPPGRMRASAERAPTPSVRAPGWWLDSEPFPYPREVPLPSSRLKKELASWGHICLTGLPEHTVICAERAGGRVRAWRKKKRAGKKAAPPLRLVAAFFHKTQLPTALSNPADHWFLPMLDRWVSPAEALRLFGVPEESSLAKAVAKGDLGLTAGSIVAALGRSLHVGCASRALDIALDLAPELTTMEVVRYASSCSGIDAFAVAVEARLEGEMRYVHASERRPSVAKALARVYRGRGLVRSAVSKDARTIVHTQGPCEIWSFTPPCEPFSKRNHTRSDAGLLEAAEQVRTMLWYPRLWRPRVILVENVYEHDAIILLSAMLLSLDKYTWTIIETEARDYTESCRHRGMWIGVRDDGPGDDD